MPRPYLPYRLEITVEVFVNGTNTFNGQKLSLIALSFSSE